MENNKILQKVKGVCQYACGFSVNLADLGSHERNCYKNNKLIKCSIDGCNWFKELSELLQHFNVEHPGQVKNLSDPKVDLYIGDTNPVLLVREYDNNAVDNSLYWLRFYKDNESRYLMMLYIGRSNVSRQKQPKVLEYLVFSIKNKNLLVKSKVIINSSSEDEDIMNDTLMLTKGTNVSVLASDHLEVHVIKPLRIPDTVLKVMECLVCMTIMLNDIKQCVNGHSFCTRCATNMTICPACRDGLGRGKNFKLQDIGQIIGDILRKNKKKVRCRHVNHGCDFVDIEDYVEDHEEHECIYKLPRNLQIRNAVVPFAGLFNPLHLLRRREGNFHRTVQLPLFNGGLSSITDAPTSAIVPIYRPPRSGQMQNVPLPNNLILFMLQLLHDQNFHNTSSNSDEERLISVTSEEDHLLNPGNTPSINTVQQTLSSTSEEEDLQSRASETSSSDEEGSVSEKGL